MRIPKKGGIKLKEKYEVLYTKINPELLTKIGSSVFKKKREREIEIILYVQDEYFKKIGK